MKYVCFILFIMVAMFSAGNVAGQNVVGQSYSVNNDPSAEDIAHQKPIRAMVSWMADNLQLTTQQETELMDFYLNTQIVFSSMDISYPDPKKEESLAKHEAKLKEILSAAQLQEFLQRGDEVQNIIMQNLPK